MKLTIAAIAAFGAGWAWMYWRNGRDIEHNAITGTGRGMT
ncbi:hypothetical protein SEA_GUDMIT_56 [Gordonia phage Gudmit]|nr:hypothetical protein SEA_GUDMIT_56 [Gordonia phage Gudmit]